MNTLIGYSIDGAMEDGGDLAHLVGEFGELFGEDGLHAVGKRLLRLMVNFDKETVGAYGNSRARKWQDFVALARAVAGIDENGQMAPFFNGGYDSEVESVARKIRKCANAALAEHDVVIALREDVFGGHQEFVERSGHAALEKNGLFGATRALEQGEVLHVAGADLNDVRIFLDEFERFIVDGFGDDAEAILCAHFRENLQAVFA